MFKKQSISRLYQMIFLKKVKNVNSYYIYSYLTFDIKYFYALNYTIIQLFCKIYLRMQICDHR